MNRLSSFALGVLGAALILCFGVSRMQAQTPPTPPQAQAQKPAAPPPAEEPKEEEENPFAAQPAPPLPPGMTGSDANDPRFKLTPGLYDARSEEHTSELQS